MKLKRKYSSSSESDDDVVLSKLVKNKDKNHIYHNKTAMKYNINKNNKLLEYEEIECEFCDTKVFNRLEILVHNASHIVIPLFKQEIVVKLNTETQDIDDTALILKENGYSKECERLIKEYEIESVIANVLDDFLVECKVNVDQLPQESCSIDIGLDQTNFLDSLHTENGLHLENGLHPENDLHPENGLHPENKIHNNTEEILGKLTSDCQVVLGDPVIFSDSDDDNFTNNDDNFDDNFASNDYNLANNEETFANDDVIILDDDGDDFRRKTVDYNLLMMPIYVNCQYCQMWFGNRLEKIKHEASHLRVRRSAANYCVACELKKTPRYASLPLCTDCAKIHDLNNIYSYTFILCKFCPNRFASIHLMQSHLASHGLCCKKTPPLQTSNEFERLICVCKVCYMFDLSRKQQVCKKMRFESKHVAYLNGLEMRCDICRNSYPNLYLVLNRAIIVRHENKSNLIDRLNFENTENGERKPHMKNGEKKLTNALRLKHIQDRLKKMRIIGKC